MLQFVDAWTNNFAYVGDRATGTDAGSYLLLPPTADPGARNDLPTIRCPTAVVTVVGRWAVDGEEDLPAVRALQSSLKLSPTTDRTTRGLPRPEPSVPEEIMFFEEMRVAMQAFPPASRDPTTRSASGRSVSSTGILPMSIPSRRSCPSYAKV